MATAAPGVSIPMVANPAIPNTAHLSNGSNAANSNSPNTPSQAVGQNISVVQAPPSAATTINQASARYSSLPSISQVLSTILAVAFGSAGIWFMYRTDRIQVWTTKKDEREYCAGLNDISVAPQCLTVLASPLEPRPYTSMIKRWTPGLTNDASVSSASWMSLSTHFATALFVPLLALKCVKILLTHYRTGGGGLTNSEASALAERLLEEVSRGQDEVSRHVSKDNQAVKPLKMGDAALVVPEVSTLAEEPVNEVLLVHGENVSHISRDNPESTLRRRIHNKPENGNESESSSHSMYSTTSAASSVSHISRDNSLHIAVLAVAQILVNDPFVKELCGLAIVKLGESRFHRNFERLLRQYALDLMVEAKSRLHLQGIRLVRMSTTRIASTVLGVLRQIDPLPASGPEARTLQRDRLETFIRDQQIINDSMPESLKSRRAGVVNFLQFRSFFNLGLMTTLAGEPVVDDDTDSDESDNGHDGLGVYGLDATAIKDVTEFLTTTQAFWNLRDNFRKFLFPEAWTVYQMGMRSIIAHRSPKMLTSGGHGDHDGSEKVKLG
ncbi:hypothetical protein ONS95_009334 [Cadophora gregata]|uniref:uncharacterized protein n=1 Tax=Cadophora gregata TaxID=51156 RepID=UPI0026DABC6C|nr:uncharacterized protein ONS95_009334 [Cadophora gregata]KAK0124367.1 hypothetical protein ONS95_009334 [Cadophora gregata]KAK0129782.1 hypothetical protein ONS96_000334 [Cadophora gregata f. sp. sojae]